jgi:hypothetical protein
VSTGPSFGSDGVLESVLSEVPSAESCTICLFLR